MTKCKKRIIIVIIAVSLLPLIIMYCCGYRRIPVRSIVSTETIMDVDYAYFSAAFTVKAAKEWIMTDTIQEMYYQPEKIYQELDKLDDNQRVVISVGKRIKYFDYFVDEGPPQVSVEYKDEETKNQVYFYTINYDGTIIDYANH